MRNKILLSGLFLIALIVAYHLFNRPFNWRINEHEVKGILLNSTRVSDEQKSKLIKAYNDMTFVRRRKSTEGSTPKYVCNIELISGEIIDIQDVSTTNFIVDKQKEAKYTSYWTNSSSFYDIAENIIVKK
ncbi:hypothetical protein ACJDUG_17680 [Clostridium sp. WILCCON 0185]|uniref:Uncharacterized protein n=2 Tax=Candidatus Clostridium stratigraminis TaxID=3381661 RepID=A0ABW8TCP3_9CLOT